jgi:hypothetical protein
VSVVESTEVLWGVEKFGARVAPWKFGYTM